MLLFLFIETCWLPAILFNVLANLNTYIYPFAHLSISGMEYLQPTNYAWDFYLRYAQSQQRPGSHIAGYLTCGNYLGTPGTFGRAYINQFNKTWNSFTVKYTPDLTTEFLSIIMLHEIGHLLDLQKDPTEPDVMGEYLDLQTLSEQQKINITNLIQYHLVPKNINFAGTIYTTNTIKIN